MFLQSASFTVLRYFTDIFHLNNNNNNNNGSSSSSSISMPISSSDQNVTDQAIAMDRYQSYFRKLDNFFSGERQRGVRIDHKIYPLPIHDFCIMVRIFKVAIFFKVAMFIILERHISSILATTSTPIETITNLMCSFFVFVFGC